MIIDPFTTNNRIYDRCYERIIYIPLMFLLIFFIISTLFVEIICCYLLMI